MKKLNRRERRAKAGISKKVGTFHKIPAGHDKVKVTWTSDVDSLVKQLYSHIALNTSGCIYPFKMQGRTPRD